MFSCLASRAFLRPTAGQLGSCCTSRIGRKRSRQAKSHVYEVGLIRVYNRAMNGITIYVDWQYFLGILGTLIGMAYYANGRFTKIETTVEWLKELLLEIKEQLDKEREYQGPTLPPPIASHRRYRARRN
jgi:hypothetical protein